MLYTIGMKKTVSQTAIIYQAKNGAIELRGDFKHETVWATQAQIAEVFGIERSVITKHIRNVFKDEELSEKAVCANFAHTAKDGKTYQVEYYNLDVIISVGYRVNSKTATTFRKWATKTLRQHITKGYTIHPKQVKKNYAEFMKAIESVQELLPQHVVLDPKAVLDLIKEFSTTWMSLDAYDKGTLVAIGKSKKSIQLSAVELTDAIADLKKVLIKKGEASEIFAQERSRDSLEGIIGNVMQSFGGKDVYKTAEEKAAHLLYFIIKNHPFIDGNKRSGAFAFIWFLRKANIKTMQNINPSALTALTLLIAESDPQKKDSMVALVTRFLQ
jgi:prophage maintenance system killer protein